MGDFGTLFPLAIGYFAVNGLDPAGVLVMMGLANIVTGIIYHLPMPIEPKKVLAVVAISQKWPPSLVYAAGFGTGIVWLILGITGLIQKISKYTPRSVVRGIQIALGITLAIEGFKMVASGWIIGIISILVVIFLRTNKYAPAAIVLMLMGVGIIGWRGELIQAIDIGFALPPITLFRPIEVWQGMVQAGFAQIALTAANAIIATSALIYQYFPDRPVPEKKLAINMGIMNVIVPFFGGMPMCHGAGGLAGQYYYGARTGGTNIIEGIMEIAMGLFLAGSIGTLFALFPQSIIGAMLLLVGVELTKFVRDIKKYEIFIMALTAGVSLLTNMAIGFVVAIITYHMLRRWGSKTRYTRWMVNG